MKIALVMVIAFGVLLPVTTGCPGPVPVPVSDIIDCVKAEGSADWAVIVAKLAPDAGDWSKLVADVTSMAPQYALNIVECVGKEMIAQYLSTSHQGAEATTTSAKQAGDQITQLVVQQLAKQRMSAGQSAPARKVYFHSKKACPAIPEGCDL